MWLGELITERGIGNGISFIIFAGIVAGMPAGLGQFLASPDIAQAVLFTIMAIAGVAVIVYIQEGQRRIPIQYASRVRGRRMYQGGATFLPLRVNQAGVIPIIFAISILAFPFQIASYFAASGGLVGDAAIGITRFLSPQGPAYIVGYFLLTVGFTYFYTAFTFKPDETADQLRKNGASSRASGRASRRATTWPGSSSASASPGPSSWVWWRSRQWPSGPSSREASWPTSRWVAQRCSSSSPWWSRP